MLMPGHICSRLEITELQKWSVGATAGITVAGGNGAGSNAN
jgi:hypothetical protein